MERQGNRTGASDAQCVRSEQFEDPDDELMVDVLEATGNIVVTQTYATYPHKDLVSLIETSPFESFRFGRYARHLGYGSWKRSGDASHAARSMPLQ